MRHFERSIPVALLILLFVYAAVSKLVSFAEFRIELYRQTIPHGAATFLTYAIPVVELIAVALLVREKTVSAGLYLTLSLLLVFSGYIALAMAGFWSRVPCSCGGVLTHMPWPVHLLFNLVFIAINLIAIKTNHKERRLPAL